MSGLLNLPIEKLEPFLQKGKAAGKVNLRFSQHEGRVCGFCATVRGGWRGALIFYLRLPPVVRQAYNCYTRITHGVVMLAVRLPEDIEKRIDLLARSTGRTKSFYVREAVVEYLDDFEDYYLAEARKNAPLPAIPLDQIERDLGLAD
jgi:RHH-type rel operon transcriptional repressor/antitoxin RelB